MTSGQRWTNTCQLKNWTNVQRKCWYTRKPSEKWVTFSAQLETYIRLDRKRQSNIQIISIQYNRIHTCNTIIRNIRHSREWKLRYVTFSRYNTFHTKHGIIQSITYLASYSCIGIIKQIIVKQIKIKEYAYVGICYSSVIDHVVLTTGRDRREHNWHVVLAAKPADTHQEARDTIQYRAQCFTNVVPTSTTLAQHWSNIGWMCRVYWDNAGPRSVTLNQHKYNIRQTKRPHWLEPTTAIHFNSIHFQQL